MADLAAVFQIVSRASSLVLELYKLGTTAPSAVNGINTIARSISSFSSTIKQLGTIIKEDDSLPSPEANETLDHVLQQCNSLLTEIASIYPVSSASRYIRPKSYHHDTNHGFRLDSMAIARLAYLTAHLDCLRSTLSVLTQTVHTAQSIIWARTRPTISPQQAAAAVANEKTQLEVLIIEQQMTILSASKLHDSSRMDARLLMEDDNSKSLVSLDDMDTISKPANLFRYQERFIASLDTFDSTECDWLPAVCGISKSHLERLLVRWTRLSQVQERITYDEQTLEAQRRETLQPTVESDIEDEIGALPKFKINGNRLNTPTPRRPESVQPLFTESATLPIPVPDSNFGPAAPISPASSYGVSPGSSGTSVPSANAANNFPVPPQSSIYSLPVDAAAAIEAKEEDEDVNLEIPWRLCTRQHYWDYVDRDMVKTNTDLPPPNPFTDRNGWTEILASWVCQDAIKEASFNFTKVQKDRMDGRRTKLETCFVIQQPLSFGQVERLVERTVEIYRQNQPPSPLPQSPPRRRTSLDRPQSSHSTRSFHDGNRTPLANPYQPPSFDRSSSFPRAPPPRPLDRSHSISGPVPPYPTRPIMNEHPSMLHLPRPSNVPQAAPYSPSFYAPPPPQQPSTNPRRSSAKNTTFPPSSRRVSNSNSNSTSSRRYDEIKSDRRDHYSSTSTTDEENAVRREYRSRSRKPSSSRTSKKKLAKVVGLAALLDGIVELGVL